MQAINKHGTSLVLDSAVYVFLNWEVPESMAQNFLPQNLPISEAIDALILVWEVSNA